MKTITLKNGIRLAYEEYGSGDKYLLSTETGFSEFFYPIALSKEPYNYHVYLVVMRGFGESTRVPEGEPNDYTTIWSQDLIAFAQEMGIDRFFYTGHSHGNYPGWYIALNRPELLRGFASCDGIIHFFQPHTGGIQPDNAPPVDQKAFKSEAFLRESAKGEDVHTNDPERILRRKQILEARIKKYKDCPDEPVFLNNTNFAVTNAQTEEELNEQLRNCHVPILLFNGGMDRLSTPEDVIKVGKLIPGCKTVIYQNMGHGGLNEKPSMVAEDIDYFFRTHDGVPY